MSVLADRLVLQDRKIGYVITDLQLDVVEVREAVGVFENGVNPVGKSLFDFTPEMIGSEDILQDILAGQLPEFSLDWVNRSEADGKIKYLHLTNLPLPGPTGEISGLIHIVQDVTAMGQLQQQVGQQRNDLYLLRDQLSRQNVALETANAELHRLDELKSSFISIAAHELNTPLSSIIGYLELIKESGYDCLSEWQIKSLNIVGTSARRLVSIIGDLLDVTRIEAGRIELDLMPIHLPSLIKDVALELSPQLAAKNMELTTHFADDVPFALCDINRAHQILINLVNNSIKYTHSDGKIDIDVSRSVKEGFIQIAVTDTGVGIDEADQRFLFRRFSRVGSASETGASGTGLGLYITRLLVELHGGAIWLESELGKGTSFFITLPISDRAPTETEFLSRYQDSSGIMD